MGGTEGDPSFGNYKLRVHGEVEQPFEVNFADLLKMPQTEQTWPTLYAAGLLFLAMSGMFMIKGSKGLVGRGAILVLVGVAIPVVYVTLAGGP